MSERAEMIEQRLRMLEKAIDTTQVGITVTDLQGRIVFSNEADARMHGYTASELLGQEARIFAPAASHRRLDGEALAAMSSWRREGVNVRKDGTTLPVRLLSDVVSGDDGEPIGVVTCCENLTEHQQLHRTLLRSSFYHPLTGLPNRGLFRTGIEAALLRSRQMGRQFAVVVADVARLQRINEAFGRAAGDQLLVEVAERIRAAVDPEAMVAHLEGDEFAIVIDGMRHPEAVERLAGHVHKALSWPVSLGEQEVFVSVAIGAVRSAGEYSDPDEVLRDAEVALHRAKDACPNGVEIYDHVMEDVAAHRLTLETQLRHAVRDCEFRVFYQPIVHLEKREVVAVEALLRWEHPTRGLLEPAEFMAPLEETGMIDEVGLWVLERTCEDLTLWARDLPAARGLSAHVNVSARQFGDGRLAERVARIAEAADLAPGRLVVEIVEGMMLPGHDSVVSQLRQLREMGVRIGVDDFGTGYSSLGYLHQLPIDMVKIDRSFLLPSRQADNRRLVRGIIALARGLDLEVITEGVEEEAWAEDLREMGCELAQGYLFATPMAAEGVAGLLRKVRSGSKHGWVPAIAELPSSPAA